ncbi:MAG TPA: restriction endonuclease subunit S [Pyrinomonadaceae bacterium]|nr:restriction endonuclease subunit S [Pyrinomonadaceae bacterium]
MTQFSRIEEFCATGTGGTPSRDRVDRYFDGGTIPWVKSGELRESVINKTEEHVTEAALDETNLKLIPAGALLLAMYGATVGRLGILGIPATTNQAVCHIIPDPTRADMRYLFHSLKTRVPILLTRRVGGAQPNISQGIVRSLEIPLPPLSEQRRIAEVLDRADLLRAKRRVALAQLDFLTQSLFLDLFGDPVTNPKGWKRIQLGEMVERITKGESPKWQGFEYRDDGALFVTSENVRLGAIDVSAPKFVPLEFNKKLIRSELRPGDLLVNLVGASIGRSCIFPGYDRPANINQAVAVVTTNPSRLENTFLSGLLTSDRGQWLLLNNRVEGARANISLTDLRELSLPVPPITLQRKFSGRVKAVEKLKTAHLASLADMDALFSSLQHRAFRGEL